MKRVAQRVSGVTLLETLVATVILAMLATWMASGFVAIMALQGRTEAKQAELDALEGHLFDGLPMLRTLPPCRRDDFEPSGSGGTCLLREDACHVAAGDLRCGSGPWRLVQIQANHDAEAASLTLLRWDGR